VSGLVYSYLRFSDPRQAAGHSAERQMQYAARWADEHGLRLDESLSLRDEGLSAYHQHHVKSGALGVFLAAVEAGRIVPGSVLVVEGLDRLSRAEPIQAQAQLAQIINAGISVVTASDGRVYSRETLKAQPMDLVYSLLVMIRAHEESDTKSKRVLASIRKQCQGWMDGTWRGVIRNGKDPAWVRQADGGKWELVPERVEAVRAGLAMFRRGYGALRIVRELTEQKLWLTNRGPKALQIYRLVRQRALLGEKELEVDGETFRLQGYYPAILTPEEWSDLQALADDRGRRRVKGEFPGVITGIGVTVCGYCGAALVTQNSPRKPRLPDGRMRDCHRRLHCVSNSHGDGCAVPGSTSVAPVERALMSYCSDLVNLQALYGGDRGAAPRAQLAAARAKLAELDAKIERLTEALLADDGAAPAAFTRRARELEAERAGVQAVAAAAERELASAARTDLVGADAMWRALSEGVEAQDYDARLQARQLVADTFERIVVYRRGMRPSETPAGTMDVVLLAKGGTSRMVRVDKAGGWIAAEDLEARAGV
jgi:DNA invertase Pin-like site-specific DNA recombinase